MSTLKAAFIRLLKYLQTTRGYLTSIVLFLIAYHILSMVVNNDDFLPKFTTIYHYFNFLIAYNFLQISIMDSLKRIMEGYLVGTGLGIVFGLLMGLNSKVDLILGIPVNFLRFIPALALFPLLILWFGAGETSIVSLLLIAAFLSTTVGVYSAVKNVNIVHIQAAQTLGIYGNRKLFLTKVIIPATIPGIFVAMRLSLMAVWTSIVAAELIGAPSGLGYLLSVGRIFTSVATMFISIAFIALLAGITDGIIKMFYWRATRWMKRSI